MTDQKARVFWGPQRSTDANKLEIKAPSAHFHGKELWWATPKAVAAEPCSDSYTTCATENRLLTLNPDKTHCIPPLRLLHCRAE